MNENTKYNESKQEQNIDLGSLIQKNKRFWWVFLLALIACMAVAALYLYKTPKTYLIMSNVLISDEKTSGSTGSSAAILKNLTGGLGGSKVDDEVIVINSHEIRHDVVKELKLNRTYFERKNFLKKINLYNTAPIAIDAPAEVFDTISKNLQFKLHIKNDGKVDIKVKTGFFETLADLKGLTLPATVKTEYGIFIINKNEFFKKGKDGRYIAYVSNNDASAEKLLKSMLVKLVSKKANVIYLRVSDTNKKRGKDILNTLEQIYNDRNQQEKDDNALSTAKFIDERLAIIYKDLAQSEINIEEFKRKNNIIDVEQQAKAIIAKQGTADKHAIALETRYRIVTMIQDFVKNPENKYAYIPFSADSTSASGSISAYNGLILKRMKLEGSALPNNQALQELDAQIDHMRANVQHGIANTLSALQVQIERARSVSNSSLDQMSNMPSQERISRDLYREQGIQNALYTFLLQKREENALTLAVTSPKGKVIDKPYAQTKPDAPNVSIVLGFALLMSIILPIIFLYLRNLLNTKFNSQEELGELTKSPILGEICHSKSGHELVVTPSKTSSVVELFKLVRNNIQFMLTNDNDKVILVTSSVSGEGKSFVSTNLAASYALLGKKVALVGMDIRSPKLADILRLKEIPGVTSYLSQKSVTVADIAQPCDQVSGLDVFVGGVIPPNPSELLISDRTQEFISQLRELYDIIVLDTAPIAMVSDTFAISKLADITIFVARANHTGKNFIKFFNDAVERGQLGKTAVILNDTNPRLSQGYGYGYGRGLDSDE